jgi:hypothetical protein
MFEDETRPSPGVDPDPQETVEDAPDSTPEDAPADGPDEVEEFEYDGLRASIPRRLAEALKPALMRQEDYTRKTTEVAEARKADAEARQRLADRERSLTTISEDRIRLAGLQERIDQYARVDWARLRQDDPALHDYHWQLRTLLKEAKEDVSEKVAKSEAKYALDRQQETVKAAQQADLILARDIKGWNAKYADTLAGYARAEFEVDMMEPSMLTNSTVWKVMHRAYIGDQLAKKAAAKAREAEPEVEAKPVPQVAARRSAPTAGLSDRLSTENWMKQRNQQLSKRG